MATTTETLMTITLSNASRKTGISESVLRRLIYDGKLKSTKIGGRYYIRLDSLKDLIENGERD